MYLDPYQVEVLTNDQSNAKSQKILNFTNIDDVVGLEFDQSISSAYYLLTSGYYSVWVMAFWTCAVLYD